VLDRNAETCRQVAAGTILEAKRKAGLTPIWKI
jgi:hypothetical protein